MNDQKLMKELQAIESDLAALQLRVGALIKKIGKGVAPKPKPDYVEKAVRDYQTRVTKRKI